jgi:Caspase domain
MLEIARLLLNWPRLIALTALIGIAAVVPAHAEGSRVALVIGNGAYRKVPELPNPPRDASDVGDALERMGFAVTRLTNADLAQTKKALADFGEAAAHAEAAIVFYAGHGIEAGGENWLIPVDAEIATDADARNRAISLRSVVGVVDKATSLGLIILDACRDNPFVVQSVADALPVGSDTPAPTKSRSISRGLAPTDPSGNVLIAFSAKDGTTAQDGDGRNSPFTSALLRHIEQSGLEVTFLFRVVRDEVMKTTNGTQQPYVYGSLSKESIYLKPPTSDQILSTMPTIAPETRPSNPLFSEEAAKLIAEVVRAKQFDVPPFQIDAIDDDLPNDMKRFIGAWASKIGNSNGRGKQIMLILTHVDKEGTVSGYILFGPPTPTASDRSPAHYLPFKTTIANNTVQIKGPGGRSHTFRLTNEGRFFYEFAMGNRVAANTLYPIWQLSSPVLDKAGTATALTSTSAEPSGAPARRLTGGDGEREHRGLSPEKPVPGALSREPGRDTMTRGQVVLVDDHSCPPGKIKQVTAGSRGVPGSRTYSCISR